MDTLNRRKFLKGLGGSLLLAGSMPGLSQLGCTGKSIEKPNILLILTDDQGYGDLGCHGNEIIRTPHIDRLASESTEFTNFYTATACAPTRASLMTGRYNYRTGAIHTSRGGAKMHGDERTLAEIFRENGYQTGIFGKWHLGDNYPMRAMDQGFQESLTHKSGGLCQTPDLPNDYFNPRLWHNGKPVQPEGYCTDIFTDAAIKFIEHHKNRPFFAYLSTNAPHTPLIVGDEYSKPYRDKGLDPDVAKIYGMVTNIDDNVGRLLNVMRRLNLEKRTMVIFMSDNGPQGVRYNSGLRGQKLSSYEGGIKVPFFIKWPEKVKAGLRIDRIAAHIDILPTLKDACGITEANESTIDGLSLWPLIQEEADNWPDRLLYFQFHRGMTPRHYQNCAVRSQKYKLVSKHSTTKERFAREPSLKPDFELYDMESDPGERSDVSLKHPDIARQMEKAYKAWLDDMRHTRGYEPGLILIGSEHENPVHLCRYQDSHYIDGSPQGWPVKIIHAGSFEVSINRSGHIGKGSLHVKIGNYSEHHGLEHGTNRAVFELPEATGILDIWFEEEGKGRTPFKKNHTIGDVTLRRIGFKETS